MNYDFIVDFQHLTEDGNRLLEWVQRFDTDKENRVLFDNTTEQLPATTDERYNSTFKTLTPELYSNISELYKTDFNLYGYDDS